MKSEIIEEIQNVLFEVQILTELAETRTIHFFYEVRKWIKKAQKLFIDNRLPIGAQIASYNGILLSIENDGLIPKDLVFQKSPTKLKIRRAAATIYMQKTVELILNFLTQMSVMLNALEKRKNSENEKSIGGENYTRRKEKRD